MSRSNDPRLHGRGASPIMGRGGPPPPMGQGGRGQSQAPAPSLSAPRFAGRRGPMQGRSGLGPGPGPPMGQGGMMNSNGRGSESMRHNMGGGHMPIGRARGPPPPPQMMMMMQQQQQQQQQQRTMGPPGNGRGPSSQHMMMGPTGNGRGPPHPPMNMNMNMSNMRRNGGPPPPPPPPQRGNGHMHHSMPGVGNQMPPQRHAFPQGHSGRGGHSPNIPPTPISRLLQGTRPVQQHYNPMLNANANGMNARGPLLPPPPPSHQHQHHMPPSQPQTHPGPHHHAGPPPRQPSHHFHHQYTQQAQAHATAGHEPNANAPRGVHSSMRHPLVGLPPPAAAAVAPLTAPPLTAAAAYSNEVVEQAWTEHTAPHGPKYYYNSLSKESTYEKPKSKSLLQHPKLAPAAQERPWAEYVDAATGKAYYSNGISTSWEAPAASLKPPHVTATAAAATTATATSKEQREEVVERPRKKRRETIFTSKEEAVAAFKGLLLAKDVSPKMKWTDVSKLLSPNPRWEACEDVLSAGERKQALAEYQTKRANELRTIERQERIRTRDAFLQLLSGVLPGRGDFSVWSTRFADVRDYLSKDDRFHAVADEATRESLFLDFCEEFRKLDERKKRNKKRDAKEAFITFLEEMEEDGKLTFASTWNSFVAALGEDGKNDPRFEVSVHVSENDRHLFFADFVTELQVAEEDKRRRIRDSRRRAEKAQREAYREKLLSLAASGAIFPTSRWRAVEELVAGDDTFGPVREQDRESPRELFEEMVGEWNESYRRDRAFLSQLVHPNSNKEMIVKATMKYDEFTKALLDEAAVVSDLYNEARRIINRESPVSSARLYFDELVLRVKAAAGHGIARRSSLRRRDDDSSEDEGEIVEEGEVQAAGEVGKSAEAPPTDGDAQPEPEAMDTVEGIP